MVLVVFIVFFTHQTHTNSHDSKNKYTTNRKFLSPFYIICNYLCCCISSGTLSLSTLLVNAKNDANNFIETHTHTHTQYCTLMSETNSSSNALSNYLFINLFAKRRKDERSVFWCNAMHTHFRGTLNLYTLCCKVNWHRIKEWNFAFHWCFGGIQTTQRDMRI